MKTIFVFTFVAIAMLFSNNSIACVDYHPDSIRVIVSGDSSTCRLEIKVTNLNMFGGSPNEFCSCGIIGAYDLGPDSPFYIDYIVFVDSITQAPLEGFDPFNFLPSATSSWEDIEAADFNWSGFVSLVNQSGITAGMAVELVIRGHYEHEFCSNDIDYLTQGEFNFPFGGGFGTDAWDAENDQLMNGHLDVTYFNDVLESDDYILQMVDSEYWTALDELVLSVANYTTQEFQVYPNPTNSVVNFDFTNETNMTIYNQMGMLVHQEITKGKVQLDLSQWTKGTYFLNAQNAGKRFSTTVIVN
jgi:hypothetical protein